MKKRLFFLSLVIALAINAMAYQSMLVDGRVWTVVHGPGFYAKYDTVMYKVDGDTIIEAETYKICLISNEDTWAEMCYLREDTEKQQVWIRDVNSFEDKLLFDFMLNVGDTLNYRSRVCEHITTETDNLGRELKKFILTDQTYIEGYGYESIEPKGYDKGSTIFLCVTEGNDTLIDFQKESQLYKPMVIDGYSWNVVSSSLQMFPDIKTYSTAKQKIEGDSIVDGIVYKKFWLYSDANSDKRSLVVLLREDIEEQKVFAYDKGVEVLLYDLGVEVGDTIKVLGDLSYLAYSSNSVSIKENLSLVVENIDFIEDPIYGTLKVITYYNADPNFNGFKCTIYERYGMTTGWLLNNSIARVGGASQRVICAFDENDELVLKREYTITGYGEVKDCYIKEKIGTNIETPQKEENIYYNSLGKTLYFDVENAEIITIYDAMGKMVVNRELTAGAKAISLDLNVGIYIVNISTDIQQSIRTKIIVK